jgi:hypothetical protein
MLSHHCQKRYSWGLPLVLWAVLFYESAVLGILLALGMVLQSPVILLASLIGCILTSTAILSW